VSSYLPVASLLEDAQDANDPSLVVRAAIETCLINYSGHFVHGGGRSESRDIEDIRTVRHQLSSRAKAPPADIGTLRWAAHCWGSTQQLDQVIDAMNERERAICVPLSNVAGPEPTVLGGSSDHQSGSCHSGRPVHECRLLAEEQNLWRGILPRERDALDLDRQHWKSNTAELQVL
jgi:hypothetical protein